MQSWEYWLTGLDFGKLVISTVLPTDLLLSLTPLIYIRFRTSGGSRDPNLEQKGLGGGGRAFWFACSAVLFRLLWFFLFYPKLGVGEREGGKAPRALPLDQPLNPITSGHYIKYVYNIFTFFKIPIQPHYAIGTSWHNYSFTVAVY